MKRRRALGLAALLFWAFAMVGALVPVFPEQASFARQRSTACGPAVFEAFSDADPLGCGPRSRARFGPVVLCLMVSAACAVAYLGSDREPDDALDDR